MAAFACPIKDQNWQLLVDSYGERDAYKIFVYNKYETPVISDAAEIYETINKVDVTEELPKLAKLKKKPLTGKDYYEKLYKLKWKDGNYKTLKNTISNVMSRNIRVSEINQSLHGTGYKAVGENQNIGGIIKLMIKIKQDEYFQLENNKQKVDQELNNVLKQWLTKLNISVEKYDSLKDRFNNDPVAVADFLNKTILIAQGKEDRNTLPEETYHFAIELLGNDNAYVQRLMQLISYTQQYIDVKQEYKDTYSTEEQFKKEAIAKAGIDSLTKANQEGLGEAIVRVLNKLLEDFLNIFRSVDQKQFKANIDYYLGKISQDIVQGRTDEYNIKDISTDSMFRLSEDFKSSEKLLKEAITNTYKRMVTASTRGEAELTSEQKRVLERLEKAEAQQAHYYGLYQFVTSANIEAKYITKEFNALNDNDNINDIVKSLSKISKYLNSYLPILKDIENTATNDPNLPPKFLVQVKKSISDIEQLEANYLNVAKPLIIGFLKPYAVKNDGTSINLKNALEFLDKDITFTQRWLDAAAEVEDDIIKITDKAVKEYREVTRLQVIEDEKDLLEAKIELEKAGVSTATFVYERNFAGEVTGYFTQKFNQGEYDKRKQEFYENLRIEFGLQPREKPDIGTRERKLWASKIRDWHDNNSQVKNNVKGIIEQRKTEIFAEGVNQQQAQHEWDEWVAKNIGFYFDNSTGNESTYYKGELTEPSDTYISESWLDIYKKNGEVRENDQAKAKAKFLSIILKKKEDLDSKIPDKFRSGNLVPQLRKDAIERMKAATGIKSYLADELKERFLRNEDDTDFGLKITDENNVPLSFIPIYYTRKLKDIKNLSTDIVTAMIGYSHMANNYQSMNKIVDMLELESDVLRERKVGTGKFSNISSFSKREPVVKKGEATYAFNRFQDYMKMVIYGEQKKDEGSFNLFGNRLDTAKTIDAFGSYVALNSLALNVYAGFSNITFGSIMTRQEAFTNEYYSNKDLAWADKTYTRNTAGILDDVGKRLPTNKLSLFIQKMNVLQDFEQDIREVDAERKTKLGQVANTSALFFINKAGEHWMQTRSALAIANTVKVQTKEGKTINLFDAFEQKGNRLVLMDELSIVSDGKTFKTLDNGKPFTEKELIRVINKQNFVNKRLHGIYNKVDKSSIQQFALGRLAIMFRKFMKPGFNRRFEKLQYNYEGETYTEGYYNTTYRFMVQLFKDIKNQQYKAGARWNLLNDFEKRNIYRSATEVAYIIAVASLVAVVTNLKGDDEDDWALSMLAYQANRLYTELRFYSSPSEALKILKSPAAAINQWQKISDFMVFWNWNEEITVGKYKGYTQFEKNLIEIAPLSATIKKFVEPEEQLKYFK